MVRAAIPDDLPDLSRLWYEKMILQHQMDRRWRLDVDAQANWSVTVSDWLKDENYRVLLGTHDNLPVGYVIGRFQTAPPGFAPKDIGAVIEMAVDSHVQSGGIGRMLFEAISDWFRQRGVQQMVAYVPHRQAVDQAFWRALGATEWVDIMWLSL